MVYIWVWVEDKVVIKELNGDTFRLTELIQDIPEYNHQTVKLTFTTDANESYSLDLDITEKEGKSNLRYFGITSPKKHFSTGINGYIKSTMEDFNDFINSELNPIRDIFDKKYHEECKLNGIKKDFE